MESALKKSALMAFATLLEVEKVDLPRWLLSNQRKFNKKMFHVPR
jgi:hypothetical protein